MMTRAALLCTLCVLLAARGAGAADVVIAVHGVNSPEGELQIEVFGVAQRATFPYSEHGVMAEVRLQARALQRPGTDAFVSLGNLAPGSYAVSVIHDVNGNGDIDLNMLGMPTEGYGFSNGARGTVGPPSFDAAAVQVGTDAVTRIDITLSH